MITVVGIDGSPLSAQAEAALATATLVVGARRHLAALPVLTAPHAGPTPRAQPIAHAGPDANARPAAPAGPSPNASPAAQPAPQTTPGPATQPAPQTTPGPATQPAPDAGPRSGSGLPRPGVRTVVLGELAPALDALAEHDGDAVVLASGDPGFFGIVRALRRRGLAAVVLPAVSSVALAFARAGLPWDDAAVVSAHGRDLRPAINVCRAYPKVAVLTGPGAGPAEIGAALAGWDRRLFVCENLGSAAEQITECSPSGAADRPWAAPNVVLVLAGNHMSSGPVTSPAPMVTSASEVTKALPSDPAQPAWMWICCPSRGSKLTSMRDHGGRESDNGKAESDGGGAESDGGGAESDGGGAETDEDGAKSDDGRARSDDGRAKSEGVRPSVPSGEDSALDEGWALDEERFDSRDAVITKAEVRALALARLAPAPGMLIWDVGAGTGSVAVECARFGAAVIAVERDELRCQRVRSNAERHAVDVRVVAGTAPGALDGLPQPDAVFVGGGGPAVIEAAAARRPDRIVVALAAIERAGAAHAVLTAAGYTVAGVLLQAARLAPLPGDVHRLAATNPVFLLWATPTAPSRPPGTAPGETPAALDQPSGPAPNQATGPATMQATRPATNHVLAPGETAPTAPSQATGSAPNHPPGTATNHSPAPGETAATAPNHPPGTAPTQATSPAPNQATSPGPSHPPAANQATGPAPGAPANGAAP